MDINEFEVTNKDGDVEWWHISTNENFSYVRVVDEDGFIIFEDKENYPFAVSLLELLSVNVEIKRTK